VSRLLFTLGHTAARRPFRIIGVWLAIAVLVVGAAAMFGRELDDSFAVPGSDSQRATALLERAGVDQAGPSALVVLSTRADGATFADSPPAEAAVRDVRDQLAALPNVVGVSDPGDQVSDNGRVALLQVQYRTLDRLGVEDLDRLKGLLSDARDGAPGEAVNVDANGELFFAFEQPDGAVGELVGVAIAAVILFIAFGSFIAMGLPIVLSLVGLAVGLSALPLVSYLIDIPSWVPGMAAMVGLGVGIDYALLLVSRHRENLAGGVSVPDSIGHALATAGRSVVFAGGTVLVSIMGLAVAGLPFVTAAGVGIAVVVLLMVTAAITLLPALLGLAGPRITRRSARRRAPADGAVEPRWERWALHVSRHARIYVVVSTAALVALAAPVFALQLGTPDDGTLPESRTERLAYDRAAEGFGPGTNGPFLVAIDLATDAAAPTRLRDALAADPGIASVGTPTVDADAGAASLVAVPTSAPQDELTRETLDRVRGRVIPTALGPSTATAHVGGQTATFVDMSDRVSDRLPAFIGAVVGVSILLLMLVFRSILVPLKAAALNLLSIGAAYGVVVMVFQWGWGASLIGVESTIPIVSFIPMFMFAIVFGLSMDYEVFLLSRMREHYLATGDNTAAVVRGLASTGRVITAAALIMVSVFLGFVAGNDPSTKLFGLGLATAIFVDATIVRMMLLPATMTLLGRANWWFPGRKQPVGAAVSGEALRPAEETA
jgi:putative drug exporter of the RND superfamily